MYNLPKQDLLVFLNTMWIILWIVSLWTDYSFLFEINQNFLGDYFFQRFDRMQNNIMNEGFFPPFFPPFYIYYFVLGKYSVGNIYDF